MFRIFLSKKIHSGETESKAAPVERPARQRNRRIYERFAVDQKHLTVMNDQDILVIRDISVKGFASDVSERAYDRFSLGDIYTARMRYHGKVQEYDVKVAWKRDLLVGFELHEPQTPTVLFFRNLVRPVQLAHSLSQVDAAFMEDHEGMTWYHGEDIDLHIWINDEEGLSAWQLAFDEQLIEWSAVHGIKTGVLRRQSFSEIGIVEPGELIRFVDENPDQTRIRLAADILASGTFPEAPDLLKSLHDLDIAI
ncbi:MAG: hypothetical protein H7249_00760 [Chitinophagaceae bacterium]|nr:hypothetical protein [Oligoflexus sp.]